MLSNLNADLRDSNTDLVQEPQQSVVIDRIWGGRFKKKKYFKFASTPETNTPTFAFSRHMFVKGSNG